MSHSHRFPRFLSLLSTVLLLAFTDVTRGQEPSDLDWCLDCQPAPSRKTLFEWPIADQFDDDAAEAESEEVQPLVTDRPDFTEASSTVGADHIQLEFGYTFVHNDDDSVRTNTHAFGEQLWRIGLFADWLELRIGWNYFLETTNAPLGRTEVDGGDDLYLGFKIALTEQADWLPEMAIIPQTFVPTGADAFTAEELLPGVNWVYSWELNECVSIGGSTQGNRRVDATGEFYSEWAQSLTAAFSLTEQLGAYTEWFAFFPHGAREPGIGAEHYVNGGFTYLVHNDLQFDIRAGFGLNDRADDFFTGTGFSYRW